jgi:hypothetical protein
MAKQPRWTVSPLHAAYYQKMTKADFADAALIFAYRLGAVDLMDAKRMMRDAAKLGRARNERI